MESKKTLTLTKSLSVAFLSIALLSCDLKNNKAEPEPEPTSLQVGLVAHMPLDGNADDISESRLNGTITGATATKGRSGDPVGAFYFDGVDDYILYDQKEKLNFNSSKPYTLSAWISIDGLKETGTSVFMSKFDGGVAASWYLGVSKDTLIRSYRNASPWSLDGISQVPLGEFVHMAATYDGKDLKTYINGVLDGSKAFPTNPNDTKTPVMIGGTHSRGTPNPLFKGTVDEVRIYSRVLEKEELDWLANH